MILQAMDHQHRTDPCVACRENVRTDRRERILSLVSALAFWLCGLTVVLLDGSLTLAVAAGLAGCLLAAGLTLLALRKADARRLRVCGGCR